ncbi:hypothetical protein [Clostridium sp. UBA3887]|uniref:hypothetical protein n=1 Tax=Clostridium sp. UBA3887 TaxID=1946356 RepID=UPI003216669F
MATNGNSLIFHIPTVFVNLRNNTGVIKRYELEICNLKETSEKRKVKWNSFCNYEDHNWTEGKKIFSIPVEEKSSVKECITFNVINNFDINKGMYKLTLTIYLFERKNKVHFKIQRYFDIGDSEALEIEDIKKTGSTEYYNRPIHLKEQIY